MEHMMDYFILGDSESSDSAHHKFIRQLTIEPLDTVNDEEFNKRGNTGSVRKV